MSDAGAPATETRSTLRRVVAILAVVAVVAIGVAVFALWPRTGPLGRYPDDSAQGAAERYQALMGTDQLEELEAAIGLTVAARDAGLDGPSLLRQDAACLDWDRASIIGVDAPVTPTASVVTFSDGDRSVERMFSASNGDDRWRVTLDTPVC